MKYSAVHIWKHSWMCSELSMEGTQIWRVPPEQYTGEIGVFSMYSFSVRTADSPEQVQNYLPGMNDKYEGDFSYAANAWPWEFVIFLFFCSPPPFFFFSKAIDIQGKILIFVLKKNKKKIFLRDYFFGSHFSFCFHSNHSWLICVVAMVTLAPFLPLSSLKDAMK